MIRIISSIILAVFTFFVAGCKTSGIAASPAVESYDLYYAPTFSRPSHFTMERRPDAYVLRMHFYRGKGGYSPQKLGWSKAKRLSADDWNRLIAIIHKGNFWSDSVRDIKEWGFLDATLIRFEGKRPMQQKTITQYGGYSAFLYDLLEDLEKQNK